MKIACSIKRFTSAGAILLSALACFHPAALAAEAFKDVSKEISGARSVIRSAEVYLLGLRDDRFTVEESDVVRSGCRYVVTTAADRDSLIDVLADAQLVQLPASPEADSPRIIIRLSQGDARTFTLVLGPDYSTANSHGEYRVTGNAINSAVPVVANNGIERDMRFWASQHRSLAPKACGH